MTLQRKLSRRKLAALMLAGVLGAVGCSHLQELIGWGPKRPTVRLKDVLVTKASLQEVQLGVVLKIFNPNPFALNLSKLSYKASAFDTQFASGEFPERVSIGSEETQEVTLPLVLDWKHTASILEKYLANPQKVKVLLDAVADFGTPLGDMTVTFREEKALSTP